MRLSQTVNGVFALTRSLQIADVSGFEAALSLVVEQQLNGLFTKTYLKNTCCRKILYYGLFSALGISGSVSCGFLAQNEILTSLSVSATSFDIVFNIYVDVALFDARIFRMFMFSKI